MEPTRYVKKPVEIDAMPWDGSADSIKAICEWANAGLRVEGEPAVSYLTGADGSIFDVYVGTLNGDVTLKPGEYVVKGVQGEFYPCAADIFEATHEEAAVANGGVAPDLQKAADEGMGC